VSVYPFPVAAAAQLLSAAQAERPDSILRSTESQSVTNGESPLVVALNDNYS